MGGKECVWGGSSLFLSSCLEQVGFGWVDSKLGMEKRGV